MSDYKSKQLQASCWIPRPGADKRTCRRFISRILFGYLFIFDEFVVRGNVTVIATFQQSFNSIRFLLRELVRSQTGSISNDLVNMHAVYNGVRWVPICSWLLHYFEWLSPFYLIRRASYFLVVFWQILQSTCSQVWVRPQVCKSSHWHCIWSYIVPSRISERENLFDIL